MSDGSVTGLGKIIILNGASSSGKSTLARQLQDLLDQPFLHVSSDQLVDGGRFQPGATPRGLLPGSAA